MFIARDSPPRKQRAPSATPTQSEKSPVHHKKASQSGIAEDFAFPPLDQLGTFKKAHKGTFSVSGPGSLVGDRPSGVSHKVTSSLPRPSPNRSGTLYDTAATRAAKAGISLSLVDSAASSGSSEHVRPRSSLTRLDQARQEAGGETPRAVKEAKSRFDNGSAASERRTVDVEAVQVVVDQPKLPTLSSPTKARAAASQQPPRQPSPSKGPSAVDAEFERKLLAAMEGGVNPFLDKRKATMRGAAQTSTPDQPAIADEWGAMVPDATPRRAAYASTLPSPVRQTPQQQKSLYTEEDSATPRAARALQHEVASSYTAPSAIDNQETPAASAIVHEPEHGVARDETRSRLSSQTFPPSQHIQAPVASSVAQSPLRSPNKRIDAFLDANDDGPSTKELTAKLNGLQIEYESLQRKLQGAQEDAQGWQSEASRLESELAEAQQAKLNAAAKATAPNGGLADTNGVVGDEALRRKYDDLKIAYQDLKVAKDEAVWMALCSTETGLEALRKAQFELICAKQEAYHEAARREEDEQQLTRAVRIARSRGQKVKDLAAANAELEERLEQEGEENARLREELERAKKAAALAKKAPIASTASAGSARRRANPAAFASDAAPSSSEMDVDEEDGDSSFAAHAVKTSSRTTGAIKSKPSSLAAAKTSSSSTSSSSGLREKIIARAEPQPRKRPAYPVLEDDSDKESDEEAHVPDEQDEEDEQAEVENDSFVVLKPSASRATAAPVKKVPAVAALKPKSTTSSASSLASKRSSVISSSTLTASTAASRIRAQEARVPQSPPAAAAAPVKKIVPAKAAPAAVAKTSSTTAASKAVSAKAAAAASAAAAAAEAEALDATKKKKRRLLGGGGAGANPLMFGSAAGASGGAASKKLLGSGAGGEDEEAENLLNPTLDLPVTLSPVKGFGGKLGMGVGAGAGRFGLGKAGGAKSMFG